MIYYIPDANSTPMPEFIHGQLQITVNVDLKALAGGTTLNIDLTSKNVQVVFTPIWTSSPLDKAQTNWLIQYIREFLNTINPMNVTLPQAFQQLQSVDVKFISTQTSGLGALLLSIASPNATSNPDPGSVPAFLTVTDHAIAVSSEYLVYLIQNQLTIPDFTINFNWSVNLWLTKITGTITYNIHVNPFSAPTSDNPSTVVFGHGQITLTITGNASTNSTVLGIKFPQPNFQIIQSVTGIVSNNNVTISPVGAPSVNLSSDFNGLIHDRVSAAIQPTINSLLQQVQASLQSTLNSQTQSISQSINNTLKVSPQLNYSSATIQSDGIILNGSIGFQDQVPVHVEFTQMDIFAQRLIGRVGGGLAGGSLPPIETEVPETELNALNSWIPGGTINKFIWSLKRTPNDPQPTIVTETHRFVTRVSQYIPTNYICLTVEGTRVTGEAVSGEYCVSNIIRVPILNVPSEGLQGLLTVAVVANARGQLPKPVAYVNPWTSSSVPEGVSNETIIHFVDPRSIQNDLTILRQALVAEKNVAAFVVLVLPHEHVSKIGAIELPGNYFLGWADDHDGGWRRTFKVNKAPATVILNSSGVTVWREHGPIALSKLKTALKYNLLPGAILSRQQSQTALNIGTRIPDLPFEYSDKTQMALSNFRGQPVILIFWASWSEPSLEELEYVQNNLTQFGKDLVILAVNSVDEREKAQETFKKHHLTLPIIIDKQNQIGQRCGINCWPTIISIDAKGIIRNISLGITEKPVQTSKSKAPTKLRKTKAPTKRRRTHKHKKS